MVEPLNPPPKKDIRKRMRLPESPPVARSRAALAFSARAAQGRFQLQHCEDCGAVSWPPRDICGSCWSSELIWRDASPIGEFLAETTLRVSNNNYFRERMPWRIGAIRLADGPVAVAHVHGDAREGARVRMIARTDKSGQGVLIALPEKETPNMADDKALRELTCDPKHRRALVSDVRCPVGQAVVRSLLNAGAAKVFLGVADRWKPFIGQDDLFALKDVEIAPLDLTDTQSVNDLAASIGGKVDILINTAQHVRPGSAMARRDTAVAHEEMEINYFGPMRLLQAFGPAMRARGADGDNSAVAWVNLLSVFALSNWAAFGAGGASHAAALSQSQSARADFAGSGVKVVNVFHGPVDDEWAQTLPPPKVSPNALAAATIEALKQGIETSFVGDVAMDIEERWRRDPDVLERELALMKLMD